jgi:alkaline phosphatase D
MTMAFWDHQRLNFVSVGTVDAKSARLWFRAERPGQYRLEVTGPGGTPHGQAVVEIAAGNARDNTTAVVYPDVLGAGAPALQALTRYGFKVKSVDGTVVVGEGRFETAPANPGQTPQRFAIGVVSCHQPFNDAGEVSEDNMRLLSQLQPIYEAHDIKFLIAGGDQMYADTPGATSLLSPHYIGKRWPGRGEIGSWTPQQIRAAYQERYRTCWNQVPWLKLLNSWPNYAILDDHEVFDDWGAEPAHQNPAFQKVIGGARLAYMDYQGSRQLSWAGPSPAGAPAALDYSFTYGTVATYVFDLRSERRPPPQAQVVSQAQLERFKAFLNRSGDAHVLLLVTSVPLIHLPEWVTSVGQWIFGTKVDFPDHWSAPQNQPQRNEILAALRDHLGAHPKQRCVVLGGDVHVGCAFELHFVGGKKPYFFELTTSALTNRQKSFDADISTMGPTAFGLNPRMAGDSVDVRLLRAAEGAPERNPLGGLNAGLVQFQRTGDTTNVRLKLFGYGPDRVAKEQFVSGWL